MGACCSVREKEIENPLKVKIAYLLTDSSEGE